MDQLSQPTNGNGAFLIVPTHTETKVSGFKDKEIDDYDIISDLGEFHEGPTFLRNIGKIKPENLYKDENAKVIKARRSLKRCQDNINEALSIDEEIERESIMNLFTENVLKLAEFISINHNLKDVIIYLQIATMAQIKDVYDREKLITLNEVLDLIRDNIFMDDETKGVCVKKIDSAGFETNEPFKEISF